MKKRNQHGISFANKKSRKRMGCLTWGLKVQESESVTIGWWWILSVLYILQKKQWWKKYVPTGDNNHQVGSPHTQKKTHHLGLQTNGQISCAEPQTSEVAAIHSMGAGTKTTTPISMDDSINCEPGVFGKPPNHDHFLCMKVIMAVTHPTCKKCQDAAK